MAPQEHPPDAYRGVDIPPAIVHHFADARDNASCAVPLLQVPLCHWLTAFAQVV